MMLLCSSREEIHVNNEAVRCVKDKKKSTDLRTKGASFHTDLNHTFKFAACGFSPPPNPVQCTFCPEYITMITASESATGEVA